MIKDLIRVGEKPIPVDGDFLVKSCEKGMSSSSNKEYLTLVLQDKTGVIDAKKWEVLDEDVDVLVPGDVVRIEGSVLRYKGKAQLKIASASPLPKDAVDRSEYVQSAPVKKNLLVQELKDFVERISDPDVKAVTQSLLKDNWASYASFPAAKSVHQAYDVGLLYHSVSVCKIGCAVASLYPELFDLDYVIAGTLLHDIGKVKEFNGSFGTVYTRVGKLESHIQIGAMMVDAKCKELKVSEEKTELLTHIILSHHGIPEYGSPVVPKTPEAFLVHVADDTDAKCDIMRTALRATKPGEFTGRILPMDNVELYRKEAGDVLSEKK